MYMDSRIRRTDVCTWTRVNKRLHGLERQTQEEIYFSNVFWWRGGPSKIPCAADFLGVWVNASVARATRTVQSVLACLTT